MSRDRKRISLSWPAKILLGINLLVIFALLLSYFAPVVNPVKWSIPSLLGLFYPVLLIINLLFLLWWIIRLKWLFLLPLLSIIVGWTVHSNHFAFGTQQASGLDRSGVKVVSYNVQSFGVHNWRIGEDAATRDSVINVLTEIDAGVVCLQEFFHGKQNYFATIEPIRESLNTPNLHTDMIFSSRSKKHFGLVTFTKFPIVNKGIIRFPEAFSNSGIFTDILVSEDTIRIFNIHLESIKFSDSDHQLVANLMEPGKIPEASSTKVIFYKIRNAFKKRSAQAKTIHDYITASPYPVIICGDFNDTPSSFAYNTVKDDLLDTFLESGLGFGNTYAGGIPFLRIDYILHSDTLNSYNYQRRLVHFSDHYPISAFVEIE